MIKNRPKPKGVNIKLSAATIVYDKYKDKITKNYLLNHINVDKAVDKLMKDIGEVKA